MSGGSWDHFSGRLRDVSDRLLEEKCEYRRALGKKLELSANALHQIEWVDSGDVAKGSELRAIKAALGDDAESLALAELIKEALELIARLQENILTRTA